MIEPPDDRTPFQPDAGATWTCSRVIAATGAFDAQDVAVSEGSGDRYRVLAGVESAQLRPRHNDDGQRRGLEQLVGDAALPE